MRLDRLIFAGLLLSLLLATGAQVSGAQSVTPIAEARAQGAGATVTVEGTVTRALGAFVRIQDASGPGGTPRGLTIRQTSGAFSDDVESGAIARDTVLQVTGTLSEFNGLLQINEADLSSYETNGVDPTPPSPRSATLSELKANGEAFESVLVRAEGIALSGGAETFESDRTYRVVSAGTGEAFDLRVQGEDESEVGGTSAPRSAFDYTGIVGQFDPNDPRTSGYQLIPVRTSDLTPILSFAFTRLFAIAQEADASASFSVRAYNVPAGTTVRASVATAGGAADSGTDVSGFVSPTEVTFTGPDPTPKTITVTVNDDGESEGVEDLRVALSSADGALALPAELALWILDDATATTTLFPGVEGAALIDSLEQNFFGGNTLGYDVARDTLYNTVFNDRGLVSGYYSGLEAERGSGDASEAVGAQGINTEHTYPQSLGAGEEPARSDMHILVPARGEVNSARSNYPYGEIPDVQTDRWFFEDEVLSSIPNADVRDRYSEVDDSPAERSRRRFEPREVVEGDVARKVFYFRIAYPGRTDASFFDDQRADLLRWNAADAPDSLEVRRNAIVATYQDRLNPFVLDPSLAVRAFAPDGIVVPETFGVSAQKSFGGLSESTEYELVGLPGAGTRPLAETLNGADGRDWKAFWDDGSDQNFLLSYEPGSPFEFQPGRGFWLISKNDWSVSGQVNSVPVENGIAEIPLHDGWNIISNPLDQDVAWSEVEAENGDALQALWQWDDGQFVNASTFVSAKTGEAYYFLNDAGLDVLRIPYPRLGTPETADRSVPELTVTAQQSGDLSSGERTANVRIEFSPEAAEGRDVYDQVAPPKAFAPVRLVSDGYWNEPRSSRESARTRWLAREARPPLASGTAKNGSRGQTMRLRLSAAADAPIQLSASMTGGLEAEQVVLVDSASGERYDLLDGPARVEGSADAQRFLLLVGSTEYVETQQTDPLPDEIALEGIYPNPVRGQATIRYSLPDAAEVRLEIFDLLGRRVASIVQGRQSAGDHQATWQARGVSSGVYLARFTAAGQSFVRKIVVVR